MSNSYNLDDDQVKWLREQLLFNIKTSSYLMDKFRKHRGSSDGRWKKTLEGLQQRSAFYQHFLSILGASGNAPRLARLAAEQYGQARAKEAPDPPVPSHKRRAARKNGKIERTQQLTLPINL
jgi:hypothetical protein